MVASLGMIVYLKKPSLNPRARHIWGDVVLDLPDLDDGAQNHAWEFEMALLLENICCMAQRPYLKLKTRNVLGCVQS